MRFHSFGICLALLTVVSCRPSGETETPPSPAETLVTPSAEWRLIERQDDYSGSRVIAAYQPDQPRVVLSCRDNEQLELSFWFDAAVRSYNADPTFPAGYLDVKLGELTLSTQRARADRSRLYFRPGDLPEGLMSELLIADSVKYRTRTTSGVPIEHETSLSEARPMFCDVISACAEASISAEECSR